MRKVLNNPQEQGEALEEGEGCRRLIAPCHEYIQYPPAQVSNIQAHQRSHELHKQTNVKISDYAPDGTGRWNADPAVAALCAASTFIASPGYSLNKRAFLAGHASPVCQGVCAMQMDGRELKSTKCALFWVRLNRQLEVLFMIIIKDK